VSIPALQYTLQQSNIIGSRVIAMLASNLLWLKRACISLELARDQSLFSLLGENMFGHAIGGIQRYGETASQPFL